MICGSLCRRSGKNKQHSLTGSYQSVGSESEDKIHLYCQSRVVERLASYPQSACASAVETVALQHQQRSIGNGSPLKKFDQANRATDAAVGRMRPHEPKWHAALTVQIACLAEGKAPQHSHFHCCGGSPLSVHVSDLKDM